MLKGNPLKSPTYIKKELLALFEELPDSNVKFLLSDLEFLKQKFEKDLIFPLYEDKHTRMHTHTFE